MIFLRIYIHNSKFNLHLSSINVQQYASENTNLILKSSKSIVELEFLIFLIEFTTVKGAVFI